jgi:uncharacterized protein (TIGR01319 family)
MPTPSAVLNSVILLSSGTKTQKGLGDIIVIDVGGATTDIYSACSGMPNTASVVFKGLGEPFFKRTVEGDLGVRYNLDTILQIDPSLQGNEYIKQIIQNPKLFPIKEEQAEIENRVTSICASVALKRASGTLDENYSLVGGKMHVQSGKDLSNVKTIIATGGALINSNKTRVILEDALKQNDPLSLTPKLQDGTQFFVDKSYVMSAMGLLSTVYPEIAYKILKQTLIQI